jgi:hypothetical protein
MLAINIFSDVFALLVASYYVAIWRKPAGVFRRYPELALLMAVLLVAFDGWNVYRTVTHG